MGLHIFLLSCLGLTLLPLAFVFSAARSLLPIQSLMTAEIRNTIAYLNVDLIEQSMDESDASPVT